MAEAGAGPGSRARAGPEAEHAPHESLQGARVVVVGLGNPLLGDDGVGWAVVDEVERRLPSDGGVDLDRMAVGGLTLMERLVGVGRAILVDAILTGAAPGSVSCRSLADLGPGVASHLDNAHDASLQLAFDAGRAMGVELPSRVDIVAVEAKRIDEFREGLSPEVAASVGPAAEAVLGLLVGEPPAAGEALPASSV